MGILNSFAQHNIFEAVMLICFGVSWPVAIIKTIRVKNPTGKSFIFSWLVIIGYISGCLHKVLTNFDGIFYLYLVNTFFVAADLILSYYYANKVKMIKL